MAKPIRVLIVDDHPMVRRGLASALTVSEGIELAGEAEDGDRAIALCNQIKPDVVLMDLLMPGTDGVTAIKSIKTDCPDTQIIVRPFDSSEIARGLNLSSTHPAMVSPDLRRIFRESSAANFAIRIESFNLIYFLQFLAAVN